MLRLVGPVMYAERVFWSAQRNEVSESTLSALGWREASSYIWQNRTVGEFRALAPVGLLGDIQIRRKKAGL